MWSSLFRIFLYFARPIRYNKIRGSLAGPDSLWRGLSSQKRKGSVSHCRVNE